MSRVRAHIYIMSLPGLVGMKKVMSSLDFLTKRNDSSLDMGKIIQQARVSAVFVRSLLDVYDYPCMKTCMPLRVCVCMCVSLIFCPRASCFACTVENCKYTQADRFFFVCGVLVYVSDVCLSVVCIWLSILKCIYVRV